MPEQNLTLQEQLLLFCLNDETGKFEGAAVSYGLNAAALAELLLNSWQLSCWLRLLVASETQNCQ